MHKTLSFTLAATDSTLNRHVSCVGLRFRFLVMALSFVQSTNSSLLPNISISKWILRERIYFTALDYFTVNARMPTQSNADLKEDIQYLLEFWYKIVAEKKYLKEENFLLINQQTVNGQSSIAYSQSDAISMTG